MFFFLLGRLQDSEAAIYTFITQASDKALGLELLDMDERLMDHGIQQAQAGAGAGTALDDGDMHRMGKVQELKACLHLPLHCIDF